MALKWHKRIRTNSLENLNAVCVAEVVGDATKQEHAILLVDEVSRASEQQNATTEQRCSERSKAPSIDFRQDLTSGACVL